MQTTTTHELSSYDRNRLNAASRGIDAGFSDDSPGELRYSFYRRKGYGPKEALSYALAWAKNAVEQYERRLRHDTGAQGWRAID